MANVKISNLPAVASVGDSTILPVVDGGVTKKATGAQIKTHARSGLATVATSGSYNDLTNKPTIPSLSGYATESYVDSTINNVIGAAPSALNTLQELATALNNNASFASTITAGLAAKANSADLATVATSGSYNDLADKPYVPEGLADFGISDGQAGQVLTTDGAGNFTFTTVSGGSGINFDEDDALNLQGVGTIRNQVGPVNVVTNEYAQLQWTTPTGVGEADPNNTSEPKNWVYVESGGVFVETNMNTGVGVSRSWEFDNSGVLHLPEGGDIVDNNGTSVLGGGGGASTGDVTFDGYRIDQGSISQGVTNGQYCAQNTSTIIYSAQNYRHSVRLFVQVEGYEGAGGGTWDTQACDVIAVLGFRDNSVSCSTFGITHTSTDPLATFTAQYNSTTHSIDILCTPTNADAHVYVSCHAIEINNND